MMPLKMPKGMQANKIILENFKQLMIEDAPNDVDISEIWERYKKFATHDMDTCGREVVADGGDDP